MTRKTKSHMSQGSISPTNLLQIHRVKGQGLNREEECHHPLALQLDLLKVTESWALGKVVENDPKWVEWICA